MLHRISFTVTDQEHAEIEAYVKAKKRWRDAASLARDALWQLISRNPVYARKGRKEKPEAAEGPVTRLSA